MDNLGQIFDPIFEFLKDGFHHVNVWWGLLIGLFATVLMRSWNQLFLIAGGAALTYIVIREARFRSQAEAGGDALRRLEAVAPVDLLERLPA